jgi:capsular exopolysaccharide synthesis family protein
MAEEEQNSTLHFLDYWRVIKDRKEVVLAVALLTIVTGTFYTVMMPKKYTAATQIETREAEMDVDPFTNRQASRLGYNPFFLMTQEKILLSRPVLTKVMHNLNLQRVWGAKLNENKAPLEPTETLKMLTRSIRVRQDRDTTLMSISVTTEDAKQSAEIANELANVYRETREQEVRRQNQNALDAMSNQLRQQQEKVEAAEDELEKIREEKHLTLLGNTTRGGGYRIEMARLNMLESESTAARIDMLARKTRLDALEGLEGDKLLEAAAFMVTDPTVMGLRQQYRDAKVSLEVMKNNGMYGEKHPDVLRLQAAIDELGRQLGTAMEGMKAGLRADYEAAKTKCDTLQSELDRIKAMDIEATAADLLPFERAERNVQIQRDLLTALRARVTQTGIEMEVPRTMVRVIEEAEPPQLPSSPIVPLNIILSIIFGLLAGVGLAFFVEYLDVSVKTVDEVEKFLGLSVLAVIPQQSRPLTEAGNSGGQGEAYRGLRTSVSLLARENGGKIFTIISGGVGEGKSTTLFNLAYVFAEQGTKVLVIDSDLRRPVQHKMVGLSNRKGLINVMTGENTVDEMIQETGVPNLWMLPSGRLRRGTLGIMNGQRVRNLLDSVRDKFDIVLMDSPPILGVTDASILASEVDGVLLVVQYRKYPKLVSLRAKRMIESAGGRLLGAVLNNINIMRDDYYYYYHYTTKKYYGSKQEKEDDAAES